jgi:hypothetical protein
VADRQGPSQNIVSADAASRARRPRATRAGPAAWASAAGLPAPGQPHGPAPPGYAPGQAHRERRRATRPGRPRGSNLSAWPLREAEHALSDDVALDFGSAAGDRFGECVQVVMAPAMCADNLGRV